MIDHHAADYCPTCGQPREMEAEAKHLGLSLDGYILSYGLKRVRLRPGVAKFARVMLEHGQASHELLTLRVSPDVESNLIAVYANFLRAYLKTITNGAVTLNCIHSWGYELTSAVQMRAAA